MIVLPIERWPRQQAMWRAVEDHGFDHAWTYDHLTWDPFIGRPWGATIPTLVAAAGVTSRIRLGTWVASPNYRHPVPFAKELAALDDISGGRAVLGIGAGGTGSDATVLGDAPLAPGDRAERVEEFVDLLDEVLTSPLTTRHGVHYRARAAATTLACRQQPRLPFVIAANGPRLMRLAIRCASGWATTGAPDGRNATDDQDWWRGVGETVARFDDSLAASGRTAPIDRLLSVDAAPTFSLASLETFRDVVGRACELGFTDVVVHWPVPGAPRYDAPESIVEAVAAELPRLRTASPGTGSNRLDGDDTRKEVVVAVPNSAGHAGGPGTPRPRAVRTVSLGALSAATWPGAVSARGVAQETAAVVAGLDSYYVPLHPGAKTRCIDGRHDPGLDEAALGPQVPGGAPGAALAYRLGADKDDLTRGTFTGDAEMMIESYLRLGLSPGGHRDNSEHSDDVGCGAIDGLHAVLQCMIDPHLVEDHKRLVRAILDTGFDRDHYLRVLGAGLVLRSRSGPYFAGRGEILDLLERKAPDSVSVLEGRHREAWVVVNLVPGTTLASNRFAADHDGAQAFGYDLWRSRQLADMLFPLPSQHLDRERFIHARVMLTIATLMALTDGSLPLLLRLPPP